MLILINIIFRIFATCKKIRICILTSLRMLDRLVVTLKASKTPARLLHWPFYFRDTSCILTIESYLSRLVEGQAL